MRCLISVMTCWKLDYGDGSQANPRVPVVRETWLRHVKQLFPDGEHQVDVNFFFGAAKNAGRPAPDEVYFNSVPDDYIGAVHKLKAIVRYAKKRGYDFVLKVDDDTYLSHEMLSGLFSNPADDYVGQSWFSKGAFAGGGAYRLSKRALAILSEADIPKIERKPNGAPSVPEDDWTGSVLRTHGIAPVFNRLYGGFLRGCESLAAGAHDTGSLPPIYRLYRMLVDKTLKPGLASNRRSDYRTQEEYEVGLGKWKLINTFAALPHFNCCEQRMRTFYALDSGVTVEQFLATNPAEEEFKQLFLLLWRNESAAANQWVKFEQLTTSRQEES